jgi:maltooligosyltrehalose trehalohydrolase
VSGGVHFRVWAPDRNRVEVVFEGDSGAPLELLAEEDGYFSGFAEGTAQGATYKYRLNGGDSYPDPASRFQPEGVHNASAVVDPSGFRWTDDDWAGLTNGFQILYELHLGTFTPEGTWNSAARKLEWLQETGVTGIEVMPVIEFPGRFGWGYDGVHWFAPARVYGTPDDFRGFVDRAHSLGIGVILDVVYNHLGPDGNYLGQFSRAYFSEKHKTDWGSAINYDGENSEPVREFTISNAEYWIREFHLDGLRLDATQNIYDDSGDHILAALARGARAAARKRSIVMIGENEPQHVRLVRSPKDGGYGLDMLWNDDFHHSAMVAMSGHNDAYYTDYRGAPQEFISAAKYGYLYQGQWYVWQDARRGTPSFGIAPQAFVTFTQNHDQIANSVGGRRCVDLTDPATYRAVTALMVLSPGVPMLFQGQEFGATTPFYYFADHTPELAEKVAKGRREFMLQFRTLAEPGMQPCLPDPHDILAFERCKLDWTEAERNRPLVQFHRDLIRIRREDPTLRAPKPHSVDGAVLSADAFLLRYFGESPEFDRLLVVSLGRDFDLIPSPEPLLAPPEAMQWDTLWSTDDPRYGGCGTPELDGAGSWRISGRSAVLLKPGHATRPREGGHPLEKQVRARSIEALEAWEKARAWSKSWMT